MATRAPSSTPWPTSGNRCPCRSETAPSPATSRPAGSTVRSGSNALAAVSTAGPVYLPAVEEHIARLRAHKPTATAADTAGCGIDNLDQQIGAFGGVVTALRRSIEPMEPGERELIEAATADLRKSRLAAAFTPLTSVSARNQDA